MLRGLGKQSSKGVIKCKIFFGGLGLIQILMLNLRCVIISKLIVIAYTLKVVLEVLHHSLIYRIFRPSLQNYKHIISLYSLHTQFAILKQTFCKMLNTVLYIKHINLN